MSADHLAQRLTWTRFPLQSAPGRIPLSTFSLRLRGVSNTCPLFPVLQSKSASPSPVQKKKKRVFPPFSSFPFRFPFGPAIRPDRGEEIRSPFTELFFSSSNKWRGCKQLAKFASLKSTRSTQQVISLFFSFSFFFQ